MRAPILTRRDTVAADVGVTMHLPLEHRRDLIEECLHAIGLTCAVGEKDLHPPHVPRDIKRHTHAALHIESFAMVLLDLFGCLFVEFRAVDIRPIVRLEQLPPLFDHTTIDFAFRNVLEATPFVAPLVDHIPVAVMLCPRLLLAIRRWLPAHTTEIRWVPMRHGIRNARRTGECETLLNDFAAGDCH